MTQKENELIFKDLLGRLPYGVVMVTPGSVTYTLNFEILKNLAVTINGFAEDKPYLRPMSSMTDEEKKEYGKICELDTKILENHPMNGEPFPALYNSQDWLNKNMFDYRGLIPMGIALEAPEGMYKV